MAGRDARPRSRGLLRRAGPPPAEPFRARFLGDCGAARRARQCRTRRAYWLRRLTATERGAPRPDGPVVDQGAFLVGSSRNRLGRQQSLAKPVEAASQNVRDLHLGDTDNVSDLLLGSLPVETQIEDVAVPLWKLLHQGSQGHGVDDAIEGGILGTDQAGERGVLVVSRRLLQGTRAALVHRAQRGQHMVVFESCVLGDLPRGGRTAAEPLLEFLDGLEDLAARLLEGAGAAARWRCGPADAS